MSDKPTTQDLENMLIEHLQIMDSSPVDVDYARHLLHRITARHYNQGLGDALVIGDEDWISERNKRIRDNRKWGDL